MPNSKGKEGAATFGESGYILEAILMSHLTEILRDDYDILYPAKL